MRLARVSGRSHFESSGLAYRRPVGGDKAVSSKCELCSVSFRRPQGAGMSHAQDVLPRIFVCYRRTDAPAHAGRIYDRLVERFGADNVYRDLDSTTPGADFAEVINETI